MNLLTHQQLVHTQRHGPWVDDISVAGHPAHVHLRLTLAHDGQAAMFSKGKPKENPKKPGRKE